MGLTFPRRLPWSTSAPVSKIAFEISPFRIENEPFSDVMSREMNMPPPASVGSSSLQSL